MKTQLWLFYSIWPFKSLFFSFFSILEQRFWFFIARDANVALKTAWNECSYTPFADENASSEMDGRRYCYFFLRGLSRRDGFRQQLVSTRSPGIMTWETVSAVLLLSTVCMYPLIFLAALLHDHQSCYCQTPAAICSINMSIGMNPPFLNTGLEQKAPLGLHTAKLPSLLPYWFRASKLISLY